MRLYLIQRGKMNTGEKFTSLTGDNGLVDLDYMGSAEFEFGAIPRAYRRIMVHFEKYALHDTGLQTNKGLSLQLFCNPEMYTEILKAIQKHISCPYPLKEYSCFEYHFRKITNSHDAWAVKSTDFWWDIENDWIAFVGTPNRCKLFNECIEKDYTDWWLPKGKEGL